MFPIKPQNHFSSDQQLRLYMTDLLGRPTLQLPGCTTEKVVQSPERIMDVIRAAPPASNCLQVSIKLWPEDLEMESRSRSDGRIGLQQNWAMIRGFGRQTLKKASWELLLPVNRDECPVELDQSGLQPLVTPGVGPAMQME